MTTHAISVFSSVSMFSCPHQGFSTAPVFRRKRMQRYNHFPFRQNIFSKKITRPSVKRCQTGCCGRKKIFASPRFPLRKTTQKGNSPPENREKHAPSCVFGAKPEYFAMNQQFNPKAAVSRPACAQPPGTPYLPPILYLSTTTVLRSFFDCSSIVLRLFFDSDRNTIEELSDFYRRTDGPIPVFYSRMRVENACLGQKICKLYKK